MYIRRLYDRNIRGRMLDSHSAMMISITWIAAVPVITSIPRLSAVCRIAYAIARVTARDRKLSVFLLQIFHLS